MHINFNIYRLFPQYHVIFLSIYPKSWDHFTGLIPPHLCAYPSQDLDFHRHMSWSLFFVFNDLRFEAVVNFVDWWNCWPSLFKLPLHNQAIIQTIIQMKYNTKTTTTKLTKVLKLGNFELTLIQFLWKMYSWSEL